MIEIIEENIIRGLSLIGELYACTVGTTERYRQPPPNYGLRQARGWGTLAEFFRWVQFPCSPPNS